MLIIVVLTPPLIYLFLFSPDVLIQLYHVSRYMSIYVLYITKPPRAGTSERSV
nr:MAG TPA: hypothetical protein [Caudoviricetes sp.]